MLSWGQPSFYPWMILTSTVLNILTFSGSVLYLLRNPTVQLLENLLLTCLPTNLLVKLTYLFSFRVINLIACERLEL
jgi:hypothetical protein